MKNVIIPEDIRKFARGKFIKRLSLFLITEITLILLCVFLGDKIVFPASDEDMFNGSQYIIYGVICLIPVYFVFKKFDLADSTYYGTIMKVEIIDELRVSTTTPMHRGKKPYKTLVYVMLQKPDGTSVRKKVHTDETANGINRLEKGKTVFHLYGTNFTAILTDKTDTHTQCVVCGSMSEKNGKVCGYCGHTLIEK